MENRLHGTVKWFNKGQGFGFITPDDGGRDLYVQIMEIETPDQSLTDGQRVTYEVSVGRKGPEAVRVQPAS
ncbi:MAG: cold-shock protein [Chlamydiia bacterium]|nr:cold-shock protein [Chlamydiia bacterium]